jgi:hypothetical protein
MTPAERDTLEAMRRLPRPASVADIARLAGYAKETVRPYVRRYARCIVPPQPGPAPSLWMLVQPPGQEVPAPPHVAPADRVVLAALREAGRPVSTVELAQATGVRRRTVWRALAAHAEKVGEVKAVSGGRRRVTALWVARPSTSNGCEQTRVTVRRRTGDAIARKCPAGMLG